MEPVDVQVGVDWMVPDTNLILELKIVESQPRHPMLYPIVLSNVKNPGAQHAIYQLTSWNFQDFNSVRFVSWCSVCLYNCLSQLNLAWLEIFHTQQDIRLSSPSRETMLFYVSPSISYPDIPPVLVFESILHTRLSTFF